MSVELEPSELGFRRPFNHEVTQVLTLRNPHTEPVAFKVKTTAPRQYCVRPNSGTIEGKQDVQVQVLLQAMKEDPPLDAKCRDKFLVQSALIITPGSGNVAQLWADIEKAGRENIKERKIRVSFLPAHDASTPQREAVNGTTAAAVASSATEDAPPAYRSPSPNYGSPATGATPAGQRSETAETENKSATTYEAAKSKIADTAGSANAALQEQLANAQSTIQQLKDQAQEQGLRQRKTETASQDNRARAAGSNTAMGVQTPPSDGVPVQIVAALCLLSFLLAYFFF